MTPVVYLRSADDDLLEIYLYLAEHDPAAAARTVRRIRDGTRRLADFPFSAPIRAIVAEDQRGLSVAGYVVLYRVTEQQVEIVRVIHAARDLSRL